MVEFERALFDSIEFRSSESEESVQVRIDWTGPHENLLPQASAIVGDAVNNLRSALDYLVYELANHNEGREIANTQFVVTKCPKAFERQKKTRLRGLTERQVGIIRKLQPFNGVQWTELLVDISNPDKHRHLVTVDDDEFQILLRGNIQDDEVFPGLPSKSVATSTGKMVFQGRVSNVLIMDKFPAVDALNDLCAKVAETLQLFYREFEPAKQRTGFPAPQMSPLAFDIKRLSRG